MGSNFYSPEELKSLGLKSFGKNVFISRRCSIYGAENISIGDHVRVDDFCILSGRIHIGSFVHISAYVALYGKGGIKIGNFCGVSPRTTIFSASDDFSGEHMISPMVPEELTLVSPGEVVLADYVQLGANCIVMPSVKIAEGAVCGAFSFVNKDLNEWSINMGIPCRFHKARKQNPKILSQQISLTE